MNRVIVMSLATLVVASFSPGQAAPLPETLVSYPLWTGTLQNVVDEPIAAYSTTIFVPGASALQVHLDEVTLATDEDAVVFRSPITGEVQRMTRGVLKQWKNSSAWFRGAAVEMTVTLAPTSVAEVSVASVSILPGITVDGTSGVCGAEDRVASSSNAICRLRGNGFLCSGSLADNGTYCVSAGHCVSDSGGPSFPGTLVLAEFNVPSSTSSGTLVPAAVADQYPVDVGSIDFENGGTGADWSVFRLHPNSSGETAFARQGAAFGLASALPFPLATVRMRGFGQHDTVPTLNRAPHTAAGTFVGVVFDLISHLVDLDHGDSGGPLTDANGDLIGVNTHAGCNPVGSNVATSIFRPAFTAARNAARACGTTTLTNSSSATQLSCEPRIISITPSTTAWNIVAVSDANDDYDIQIDNTISSQNGSACDFLVSDGNATPTPDPVNAFVFGIGSVGFGDVQFRTASTMNVGSLATIAWGSNQLVEIREFLVTTTDTYDITVAGASGFNWRVYRPNGSSAWRTRSNANVSGAVNGGTLNGVSLTPGVHALVIFKDGNPGAANPSTFTAMVAHSTPSVALTTTTTTVTADGQPFTVSPIAGNWTAVSASSPSDWNIAIGTAFDTQGGTISAFVLADGHAGTITPTEGVLDHVSGSDPAEAQVATGTTISVNDTFATSLSAGSVIRIYQFNVTVAGNYDVGVTGGDGSTGLNWRVYAPDGSSDWRGRSTFITGGDVGGTIATGLSLSTGWHALVVFRDGGSVATATSYQVHVYAASAVDDLTLGENNLVTAQNQLFTVLTGLGQWNAVGVTSTGTTECDAYIGTASSTASGGGNTDFVLSNGHLGATPGFVGIVTRDTGTDAYDVERAAVATMAIGTTLNSTFASNGVIRLFEFPVTATGSFDVTTTGLSTLGWSIFAPGSSAAWIRRADDVTSGIIGGGAGILTTTQTGTHVLAVYRTGATGSTAAFSVTITPRNPVPTVSTVSPSSILSGASAFTLTVNGTGFVNGSVVRWNGVGLATTFVSATQLTASVPAANVATAGTASVTAFNAAPGGGTSGPVVVTINNPVPIVASLSPASATAGGAAFTLTVNGSSFRTGAIVRWNGANRATTFVSATQLTASITAADIATAGSASVTVVNAAPGGGTSGSLAFAVNNPLPALAAISPASATSLGAAFTLTATGSNFRSNSIVRWNGVDLATTFVSATQLTAAVPAANLTVNGTVPVTVFTPAPGGGTTAPRTFTINDPVPAISAISPTSRTAGGAAFTLTVTGSNFRSTSSVQWNGSGRTTTFVSPTQLTAAIPASDIATGGSASVTVSNPVPGGGTSGAATLTVNNPTPVLASVTPATILAGAPSATLTLNGSNFNAQSQVRWNGSAAGITTLVASATQLTATIPGSLLNAVGAASVTVFNPVPSGGTSVARTVTTVGPRLLAFSPTFIAGPVTAGSPPTTVTFSPVDGISAAATTFFVNGHAVAANMVAAPVVVTITIPSTIAEMQRPGGVTITARNFGTFTSNAVALEIGDHNNRGTIEQNPVAPAPGQNFTLMVEDCLPNVPFMLFADPANITPLVGFPDPVTDLVLGVNLLPQTTILDGIGVFMPAQAFAVFSPDPVLPGRGRFALPGLVQPNPPLNATITLQVIYPDPSLPAGFRLTHARGGFDM